MQQTKRRSKKGVILLALTLALLVLAVAPAASMAVTNTLSSVLTLTPAPVPGQGGVSWISNSNPTGVFTALYNGLPTPPAGPAGFAVHGFSYWVDGGAGQFIPGNPAGPVSFGPFTNGVHTITHAADTTQTVTTPPDPHEPLTDTRFGVDMGGPVFGGAPVWSWTLTPPDPGGDLTSPDPAQWYGNVPVTFLATASDPGGSGIDNAYAEWTNLTTSTAFPTSPPALIHQLGYPIDGNPFIFEVTGTVTVPNKVTYPTEPLLTQTAAYSTTVYLTAEDLAGNFGYDQFTVNHDVWAPVTSDAVVSPLGADTFAGYTNKDVTVKWLAADNLSGVAYSEYIVKTSSTTTPPSTPALTATGTHGTGVTITDTAPMGPVYVFYRSVDKAVPANLEQWHLVRIYIDKNAPILSDDVPSWWIDSAPIGRDQQDCVITISATDPNSGIAPFGITWEIEGHHPGLFGTSPGNTVEIPGLLVLTGLLDGIHNLTYSATDNAGNTAEGDAQIKIDTRAPVTDGAAGWINGTVPYVLTATDQAPGAGVAVTLYRWDQQTPWMVNEAATPGPELMTELPHWSPQVQGAIHTIDFASVDAALPLCYDASDTVSWPAPSWHYGNIELAAKISISNLFPSISLYQTRTVRLDVTGPSTTVSPDTAAWKTSKPVVLTFTATDTGAGIDYTEYNVAGAGWVHGTSVSINAEGATVVQYRSVDKVGIVEATHSTTVNIDTVAPVTTVAGAVSGWSKTPVTLTFTATDATSGVDYTEYSTNGGSTWTKGNTVTVSTPGVTSVMYRSVDKAGNVEVAKTVGASIDTTTPVTTVTGNDTSWHKVPVTLDFSATGGPGGIAYTEWSTDGGTTWTKGNSAIISKNGEITVSYRSVSNSGVTEATKTVKVWVSTTRPSVTAENASVKSGSKATISFNITAITPTATSVVIEIRTKAGKTLSIHRYANVTTNSDQTRSFRVKLPKGKYNIRVGAVDMAGNEQAKRGSGTLTVR